MGDGGNVIWPVWGESVMSCDLTHGSGEVMVFTDAH